MGAEELQLQVLNARRIQDERFPIELVFLHVPLIHGAGKNNKKEKINGSKCADLK